MKEDHGIDSLGSGSELWSLHEDVQVELESSENLLRVRSRWGDITIRHPSEALRDALYRMTLGPISLDNVTDMPNGASLADAEAPSARYSPARIQLAKVLDRLQPLIIRSLGLKSGQPLLSVVPMTARARFRAVPVPPDAPVRLSTYAELRTNGREYSLESPLSLHRVVLHRSEAVALIGVLGRPITAADPRLRMPEPAQSPRTRWPTWSPREWWSGRGDPGPGQQRLPVFAEDADPALVGWSGLDLMFHTRRTLGRHDNAFGASYPLGRQGSPEPVSSRRCPDRAFRCTGRAGRTWPRPTRARGRDGRPPVDARLRAGAGHRRRTRRPAVPDRAGALPDHAARGSGRWRCRRRRAIRAGATRG